MRKGLIALSLGTFVLGMTEYVMMSILPDLAHDFNVSVPVAGQLISSYAIGVCIGAPLVAVFLRNWKLNHILLLLMAVCAVGNVLFASAPTFKLGLAGRFIAGLPHGAFFGTGSIVASRLMPGKATTAVSMMTFGMTIANLAGIPVGSFIANTFTWRWIFYFNALFAIVTIVTIALFVRGIGSLPPSSVKGEFRFLKKTAPWVLIVTTLLCQGGAFAMYSYVTPIMRHAGLALKYIPLLMIVVGGGMCLGNYYSGVLSDRYSPTRVLMWVCVTITMSLVATYFDNFSFWTSGATIVVAATCLFALSSPMQLLLIEYSPGGELMGGAMVQIAFNLGNAVGAYLGGLPITAGHSPEASSLVGALLTSLSIVTLYVFIKRYKHVKQSI